MPKYQYRIEAKIGEDRISLSSENLEADNIVEAWMAAMSILDKTVVVDREIISVYTNLAPTPFPYSSDFFVAPVPL